ncbi:MAG: hypothetical protein JRJ03_00480 [Deltaproteobacteria bacterium]|nr:hypothetical protein [Deltaproteobacteria bacterium]
MPDTLLDVSELEKEDIQFLKRLVEVLREQAKRKKAGAKEKDVDDKDFTAHPSDVMGKLSRREIYDYL